MADRAGRRWLRGLGLVAGLVGLMVTVVYAQPQSHHSGVPVAAAVEETLVRDTEAEAIVAAAALNQPVEVLAYRSEVRDVFAQPDGTLIANDYTSAVRVIRGDSWVPADATLVQQPDGSIAPAAALIGMRLSAGGTDPFIVVERDQKTLALQWPYPLPVPTLNGDQAVYAEVFPDVDLVLNITVEGFSQVIVLKTPEAADLPELETLEIGVTVEGLIVQETEDGGIVALDPATGNPVIEADAPTMWDSGPPEGESRAAEVSVPGDDPTRGPLDSSRVAPVGLGYADGILTLTPDVAMVADPQTNWPIYMDPVWQATSNSAWAMVDSGYPNEEYWKFDGKRHERIGLCPESCNSSKVKRLFYRLATPYSGKTILSAEFRVTMQHAWNSTPRDVGLYLMPSGISSSTNWNNQPGGSGWGSANWLDTRALSATQSSCTATNQNAAWNAKEAVQLASINKWSTITLGVKASNESNYQHSRRFCDNAVLSVKYNRAPSIPNQAEMSMSPGGLCVSGASRPYVDTPPKLNAVLRDPDHSSAHTEQVKGEFKVTWTPDGGSSQTRSYVTPLKASGSLFSYTVPADIPEGVIIFWQVRASDNTSWGPWSSDGSRSPCEFILDTTVPSPPDIDSADYLPGDADDDGDPACFSDDEWRGSIGVYSIFTFDSAADDVVEYRYGFNSNPLPTNVLRPQVDGGPVSVQWIPDKEGPWVVNVVAFDRAGRSSSTASCTFRVGKRPPVAHWSLSDVAGDHNADDQFGLHDAVAGSGVTFGVSGPGGASDTAARLDGTANGYLATAGNVLADTSESFALTAWVKVSDTSRRQVAISQNGSGEPGFSLGVDGGSWVFRIPVTDVDSLGEWKVSVPGATTGWTYLSAAFDATQRTISLQVDDSAPVIAERRSLTRSRGPLQLGRRLDKSGYTDFWSGELADVSVFDRLVQAEEVVDLKQTAPNRRAYWPLNTEAGQISPEHSGGAGMTLGAGASIYRHPVLSLLGGGHLKIEGEPAGYAATTTNADMAGSFSIAARVKLTSSCAGTPMTVFSQKGANNSSVLVRCNIAGYWELAVSDGDSSGAAWREASSGEKPNLVGKGDHLTVVYNAYTREMLLYVNGYVSCALDLVTPFNATGGLQLAQAFIDGNFREHLSGAADDVRIYNGVADTTLVQRIAIPTREALTL